MRTDESASALCQPFEYRWTLHACQPHSFLASRNAPHKTLLSCCLLSRSTPTRAPYAKMLTRSLGRRLAWDARQLPSDNSCATVLLSALTRHYLPTPSSTPPTASSLSYRNYATRSTGTQTVPRKERKPPASSKSAKSAGSTTTKKKPAARTAKKPAKKAAAKKKKKPAAKKRKKAAPKRVKKAPTQLEKQLAKVKQLKSVALLDEPKKKPTSVWQLVFAEAVPGENVQMRAKEKATKYKNLQASEREVRLA